MADTYWDPANLLQITDLDDAFEIQCLGRARNRQNARCRLALSGPDAAAALAKIKKMAASPPTKVTQQDLEDLAKLCLCHDIHFSQWYHVAQRWKPVVAKAVRHHDRLTMPKTNGPSDRVRIEALLVERRQCCDMVGVDADIGHLPDKVSAHLQSKEEDKSKAEAEVDSMQGELDAAYAAQSAAETQLQKMKDALERANMKESQLREELEQAKTKVARLATKYRAAVCDMEEIRTTERARLAGLLKLVEAAKADRDKHEARFEVLEKELAHTRRCLEEERAKSGALKDANIKLEERLNAATKAAAVSDRVLHDGRAKTKALEKKRDDLEHSLSESSKELATARHLLKEEEFKTAALRDSQEEYHRRLTDACKERDRLLAQERRRSSDVLQETTLHLEQRLQEVNAETENLLRKERTKARVLADIRVELKRRLSEVRADAAAESQKRKRDMDALRKKHRAAIDEIHSLQSELDKAKAQQSTLECDVFEARDTAKTLQSLNDQLTTSIAALQHYINTLQQKHHWRTRLRSLLHLPEPSTPSLTPIGIPQPPNP